MGFWWNILVGSYCSGLGARKGVLLANAFGVGGAIGGFLSSLAGTLQDDVPLWTFRHYLLFFLGILISHAVGGALLGAIIQKSRPR